VFYLGSKLAAGIGRAPFSGVFETIEDAIDVEIRDVRLVGPDIRVEMTLSGKEAA
jgi:hypothetical protein